MATNTLGTYGEELNLDIRQGATFGPHVFTMTDPAGDPIDLTGCTITAKMKKKPGDLDTTAVNFTIELFNPTGGQFRLSMSASTTSAQKAGDRIDSSDSKYVWDMEMTDSAGIVTPLYYGVVRIFRNV